MQDTRKEFVIWRSQQKWKYFRVIEALAKILNYSETCNYANRSKLLSLYPAIK